MRSTTFLSDGGHVALGDPEREPLDDGRLADARLAGQDRVVLAAADQDIDHLADLGLAADHRVDFSLPRPLGQVDRVLVERGRLARCRPAGRPAGRGAAAAAGRPLVLDSSRRPTSSGWAEAARP